MEGYIAEIRLFAGTFAPRSWAFCQGQIMSISQNTALFSLLGTTYGGDGQTTFALPDFRGRVAVGTGQGPGLPTIQLGQVAGETTHTLIATEMPAHSHTVAPGAYNGAPASSANPANAVPSIGKLPSSGETLNLFSTTAPNASMAPTTSSIAGGSQPHNNMQPYLGMNYIICLEGIYPSRN
jgi:microcystin-dependent protein